MPTANNQGGDTTPINLPIENDQKQNHFKLSPHESECLFLYIRGLTAKEIALRMKIHFKSVQNYLASIKDKMSCNTRSQIVEKAINQGMGKILPKPLFLNAKT